jgi:hypothetical protein
MAEWFKALVLKTRGGNTPVGSNPTFSANFTFGIIQFMHITCDEKFSYKTYGGSLEGLPPLQVMLDLVNRRIEKSWGQDRPTHIIPYVVATTIGFRGETKERLPTWCHCYWFNSYTPIKDPSEHGSHLIVVYFSEQSSVDPDEVLKLVDWNKYAEDFSI